MSQLSKWTFNRPSKYFGEVVKRSNNSFLRTCFDKGDYVLNLCCGYDANGDVISDVDMNVCMEMKHVFSGPEVVCSSIFFLPFRSGIFDVTIIDPPFSFYKKYKWLFPIFDITRKRVVLSAPAMNIGKTGWTRRIFYIKSNHLSLRLWYVFDRMIHGKEKADQVMLQ